MLTPGRLPNLLRFSSFFKLRRKKFWVLKRYQNLYGHNLEPGELFSVLREYWSAHR